MPTVNDVLAVKGPAVHEVDAAATVLDATRIMNQQQIGALVVTAQKRVVGVFTERDVLRRVVAEERAPGSVLVADVMTRQVIFCCPDTELDEAARILRDRRIRHLPVCDRAGQLVGLVSIGDINAHHASTQEAHIHFLHEYCFGRP